jgi:lysophospholipase L1-like esterase
MTGPVVLFGDSLAVGVSAAVQAMGYPVVSLGIVGSGLQRGGVGPRLSVMHTATAAGAVLAFISLGTNDHPDADYEAKLLEVRRAVAAGVSVVWLMPPPGCGRILSHETLGPAVERVAAAFGDRVVDYGPCSPDIRAPDGVHFTPRGYANIARQALESVSRNNS